MAEELRCKSGPGVRAFGLRLRDVGRPSASHGSLERVPKRDTP